jgi:hypothetical protein
MALSHRATIGLLVGFSVAICILVFFMFWKCLMPAHRSLHVADHRLDQLRARRRDLEAQVHAEVTPGEGSPGTGRGSEVVGDRDEDTGAGRAGEEKAETVQRMSKAHLAIHALRHEQWERARAMDGRPVPRSPQPEIREDEGGEKARQSEEIVRKMILVKVKVEELEGLEGMGVVVVEKGEVERPGKVSLRGG